LFWTENVPIRLSPFFPSGAGSERVWIAVVRRNIRTQGGLAMGKYQIGFCAGLVVGSFGLSAWGDPGNRISVNSLIGKYDGVIQVVKTGAVEHAYQTEVVSVNQNDKTVSLSAYCTDCTKKELKRTDCQITEAGASISFVCKGPRSDEVYRYNGRTLQATGFGNHYPYAINVTKIR
jgi:hypothetical protein